jgi:outer membrane protein TolC
MKFHILPKSGFILVTAVFFASHTMSAQSSMDSIFVLNDTIQTLSLDEFYKVVLNNHPVVKQANLLNEMAQQEIRLARGNFDPKLASSFNTKEFEDKTYYSKLDANLTYPTWFPVNPKVGYQRNVGELVNNEDVIDGERQLYAGVSIPIGRGLFTDERRTAVRQAKLFTDIATADQVKIINKILLDAAKDYWQWYNAYYQYRLSNQAVVIAQEIFTRTKVTMEQGEAAEIDTVQAKITFQTRLVDRQEALLNFLNTSILISNYLWDAEGNPLQLEGSVAPIATVGDMAFLQNELLENLVLQAKQNHPDLIKLSVKLNQLELERSLAREFLKPQLDLNYFMLSQPGGLSELDPLNDYKVGVDFSFPLFLRKERSKVALAKLKIENTTYQRSQAEREIINQINSTFNEVRNTRLIVLQQDEVVRLYDRLLAAEMLNLENGESDLFKINIQQEKLLQAQSKLLKLTSDIQKQKALLYWAAGSNLSRN